MTEPANTSEHEQQLDAVVASYLEAIESGRPLNREELLGRHPDLRAELAAFFAEEDKMNRLTEPLRPASTPPIAACGCNSTRHNNLVDTSVHFTHCPAATRSGSFVTGQEFAGHELLQEVARGGMGVVYRARHVKLNR